MYEDFLPLVQKPARYINSEINAVHKDLATVRTKVCLFFPGHLRGRACPISASASSTTS